MIAQGNYSARASSERRDEVGSLARSFNEMAARLEELEHTRRRQLAAITHELARPLTGMRAAIETLQDGSDAQPQVRMLLISGVIHELARMQRLVEALQQVQRQTLHPVELARDEVALERLIRAPVSNFEALAAQGGITLTTELPPGLPHVYADQDRLIQVLTNLLDNAFKFTPAGGRVVVSCGQEKDNLWVSVAESGIGISPDELPDFQEFYRGGSGYPVEKSGTRLVAILDAILGIAVASGVAVMSRTNDLTCELIRMAHIKAYNAVARSGRLSASCPCRARCALAQSSASLLVR